MERFKVTFTYSEPSYAQARGIEPRAYRGVFDVTAADPDEAVARATQLFREAQRSSGVSWARVITSASWERHAVAQRASGR
jgi:hypothetical protein